MNNREKRMAMGVAALVGLLMLYYVYSSIADQFTQRETKITQLEQTIAKNKQTILAGNVAKKRLTEWEHRSSPQQQRNGSDQVPELVAGGSRPLQLESPTFTTKEHSRRPRTKNKPYDKFSFQVKGRTDVEMKQLVQFLYEFYASNQLHTIRSISLTPDNNAKKLDVVLEIEALVLPTADRTDELAEKPLKQLARGDTTAYQKVIGGRNLFAEYKPPQAASRRASPRYSDGLCQIHQRHGHYGRR